MKTMKCVPQKISKLMLGSFLLVGAMGFTIIGFTLLPFIGFLFAVPFVVLAIYVFKDHLNDQCNIDYPTE